MKKLLIIIPIYNNQKEITKWISTLKLEYPTYNYLIIDNGSTDNSSLICDNHNYNFISLAYNHPINDAIAAGFKYALNNDYQNIIVFNPNQGYSYKTIGNLAQEIEKNYHLVITNKYTKINNMQKRPMWLILLSFFIERKSRKKIVDPYPGVFLISKDILETDFFYKEMTISPNIIIKIIKNDFWVKEISAKVDKEKNRKYFNNYPKTIGFTFLVVKDYYITKLFSRKKNRGI